MNVGTVIIRVSNIDVEMILVYGIPQM